MQEKMNYNDGDFEARLDGSTLKLKGKIEKSDYTDLTFFLKEVNDTLSDQTLILDIKELDFLNSSGIRTLAVFFMGSDKKIEIHINDLTWQRVGIVPLEKIKPNNSIKVIR